MAAESLRDELLALPGVAEVELDGEGSAPAGVRVRLAAEADPERVGIEVQRVLAAHGMRSRVDGSQIAPPPLPLAVPAPPPVEAPVSLPLPSSRPGTALDSVHVEESASALSVTVVATDGRRVSRQAGWSEEAMAAAAIEAVGLLLEGAPSRVVAVDWIDADGSRVVTVVVDSAQGGRSAGAAVVRVSRAYAVARAAWAALSG